MDYHQFVHSLNIEDRRNEHYYRNRERGPFGTFGDPPNVFEGDGTMAGLNPARDFQPVQRTSAGVALGQDELESTLLKQQQDNQVRDALDNASVAVPGQNDPNGPVVRINNRAPATPVPLRDYYQGLMSAKPMDAPLSFSRLLGG